MFLRFGFIIIILCHYVMLVFYAIIIFCIFCCRFLCVSIKSVLSLGRLWYKLLLYHENYLYSTFLPMRTQAACNIKKSVQRTIQQITQIKEGWEGCKKQGSCSSFLFLFTELSPYSMLKALWSLPFSLQLWAKIICCWCQLFPL